MFSKSLSSKCKCGEYGDIELSRQAIDDRIKASRKVRKNLRQLAESTDKLTRLYQCDGCNQLWQESLAWGWEQDNPIYLYKVPALPVAEWLEEPYIQPHQLGVFNWVVERVLQQVVEKDEPCNVSGCPNKAITGSLSCLEHHIESLQRARILPQSPKGRWFAPYTIKSWPAGQ